ncbi:DEAD/DEAH box helicase family protein [Candidatus Pelagibacter sp.]|nr:DEAD/DEAH box helicase family protein [Candidatus Pelagibacter sp.]
MAIIKASRKISECSSWKEINSQLEELTKSEQTKFAGDIFELITKHFLLTDSKYKSSLRNVWLLDEVPENVKINLNLPDQDEGIDLIAETKQGKFWAIQSKYRSNPDENLTLGGKGGLATFSSLAFTYCKNISHGLVVTTVNRPPKKMKLINDIGFETLESFLSLDDNHQEGWEILKNSSLEKIVKPKKLNPRPHQTEGINKAIKYFETNDRGKIIMPCGTGKSILAFWVAKEMNVKNILISIPSLALIQQTLKTWTRELIINDLNADWLCVCSDDTVKEEQDSFVSFTYDLGIKVTTNKSDISEFLYRKTSNYKIIFTTYHSGKILAEASRGFSYDLAIMDEAHKTVGHKEKLSAYLIHQKNINIKKRLFMTATERLFRRNPNEYLSMDSIKDYGNIIYDLTFKKAIEADPQIISDYKIITFNVTDQDIKKIHSDNKFIRVAKELNNITAREFATAIALRKAIQQLNIKNAISFHASIKRAKNFQKQQEIIGQIYSDYTKLKTFHVSGEMPVSKRASQMRLFAESKGLMTNARCLTEGVDLPAIDCVCFTDPKRSKVDIVQASGRALRLSQATNKKFGYILVPLYVPDNLDPETASKDTAFEEIISVIGALATQDSRILEYLRQISLGNIPSVGTKADGIISFNFLSSVDSEKFINAILIKIWDRINHLKIFLPYDEAKNLVQKLKIKTEPDLYDYVKKNPLCGLPSNPDTYYPYKKNWKGYRSFFNTEKKILSFYEAKEIVQKLKFKSLGQYQRYRDKNLSIGLPSAPNENKSYKKYWKGYVDFFGPSYNMKNTRTIQGKKNYLSYSEAKELVQELKFKTRKEYLDYRKANPSCGLPEDPDRFRKYEHEWEGLNKFFGKSYKSKI